MREPARGAVARATAVAESLAAAVRRRQLGRGPRVLLHRHPGDPVLVVPGARGHDELIAIAQRMVNATEPSDGRR